MRNTHLQQHITESCQYMKTDKYIKSKIVKSALMTNQFLILGFNKKGFRCQNQDHKKTVLMVIEVGLEVCSTKWLSVA